MLSQYVNLYFPVCSLTINFILYIIFIFKNKSKNVENKIYKRLLIISLIESLIMFGTNLCVILFYEPKNYIIFELLNKTLYSVYIIWTTVMFSYIYTIGNNKNLKLFNTISLVLNIILITLILITPIEFYYENNLTNSSGMSANILYIGCAIYDTLMIIFTIINYNKTADKKKYVPLLLLLILMTFMMIIRQVDPLLNISSNVLSVTVLVMYFTIENPDLKLIEEIKVAKKFSDDSNYEKSLFLFNMSQDIKRPINNINEGIDEIYNLNDIDLVKERLKQIEVDASNLCSIVNNVLDLSATDVKNIKVVDNKYNIKNLLKEIIVANKTKIEKQGVEFRFNIDKNIPEYLLGDSIKLKQIMNELIKNAIKHTKTGFISLDATCVNKMDLCRLLIYVEDSGAGIKVSDLDKIFNSNDINLDDDNLNLTEIKKMLNVIGGTIIANSEYNKGSKFTIVLDQKIDNEKMSEEYNLIDKYKDLITSDKKVLVVDDSEASIKIITKLSNALNVEIESVKSGKECLDKIRNKEKYDLILIDDDMPKLSGYDTLEKLKQIKNFNTKVVLLTNDSNLEFEDTYKKYGFTDILVKPVNKSSLTKIYNDNLKND